MDHLPLSQHRNNEHEPVMVSVVVSTYKHESFIAEALESILMQVCNFRVEILVNDDASPDQTANVVKNYESKYPKVFRNFYQVENQYSKGIKPWFDVLFPAAKGKYIALCEGDDYWTDPHKLQKQVDFLESNPEYVITTHDVDVIGLDSYGNWFTLAGENKEITIRDWIMGYPAQTCTYFFRSEFVRHLPSWFYTLGVGDMSLVILLMSRSNLKCYWMKDKMSVYRLHHGGITSGYYTSSNILGQLNLLEKLIQTLLILKNELHQVNKIRFQFLKRLSILYLEKAELHWYLGDSKNAIRFSLKSIFYYPKAINKRWLNCFYSSIKLQIKFFLTKSLKD
jgi:glycosyltransferase involved in cell wall biosynthesis